MLRKTRTKLYREKTNFEILQKLDTYFLEKKIKYDHCYNYINLSKLDCFDINFLEYDFEIIIAFLESISKNPNFKIEWLEHPTVKEWIESPTVKKYNYFCWNKLINHKNFKIEWVEKYPDKDWNWEDISSSPNFQIEWVDKYPDKKWDWEAITQSKNITLEFIKNNPHYPWKYTSMLFNPQCNIDWIEFMVENKIDIWWGDYGISDHKNLRFSWIEKFPNIDWCWEIYIPYNKYLDITKENIIKYGLDKIASKGYINPFSKNINLTLEIIEMFPKSKWDVKELSKNPNLTIEWINKFPKSKWDFSELSKNPNLTIEWINKFPKATGGFIKWMNEYPKDKWDFKQISKNPNLTIEWINQFPEEKMWHPKLLFEKMFYKEKEIAYRKYLAAYKIQQWWHNITLSPEYVVGRKFINRKYDNLF